MVISVTRVRSNTRGALSAAGAQAARRAAENFCGRGKDSQEIRIEKDALGKPLGFRGDTPIALSISHSYPFALGAAEEGAVLVGADIERVRDFSEDFWKAFSTQAERAFVSGVPAEEQARYRTLCWSLKESTLKALGVGLRMHPRHIDTAGALSMRSGMTTLKIQGLPYRARVWQGAIGHTYIAAAIVLNERDAMIIALPIQAASWNCAPSS